MEKNEVGRAIIIKNGTLITPFEKIEEGFLIIKAGRIAEVGLGQPREIMEAAEEIDAKGSYVLPGFIDLHIHGGGGHDVMGNSFAALNEISKTLVKEGVTSFLPTTLTAAHEGLLAATESVRKAMDRSTEGAEILGVHLEGPYFNPQRAGGQPKEFMRPPSMQEVKEYIRASGGKIKILSLAPEMEGALDLIRFLDREGMVAAIGHSDATYEETLEAAEAGLRHATHTFNAMREFHHREPGTLGAVLTLDSISAEVIADGVHVHPASIKILIKCKGYEKVVVISDAIMGMGAPDGEYQLGGRAIIVQNGASRFKDGGIAGSAMSVGKGVKNLIRWLDLELPQIIQMATLNPARAIGEEGRKGSLEVGKDADIIICDQELNVKMTIVRGRVVHQESDGETENMLIYDAIKNGGLLGHTKREAKSGKRCKR